MLMAAFLLALQAEPSPEAFAVFASNHGTNASLWSFDPARPDAGVVKRAEFPQATGWGPDFLSDDSREFLRIQIPTPDFYDVHLYRVDYGTWTVRKVLETKKAFGLGANATDVFVSTDAGLRVIDRKSGAVRASDSSIDVKARLDRAWIVRTADGALALLDVSNGRVLDVRFRMPDRLFKGEVRMTLSPDLRRLAIVDLKFPDDPDRDKVEYGKPIVLGAALQVMDLGTGGLKEFPIRIRGSGGSGRWFIPHGFDVNWATDGSALYCTTRAEKLARLKLDPATLKVISEEVAEEPIYRESPPPSPVPEALLPAWTSLEKAVDQPDRRLAHALLKFSGLDYAPPRTWAETRIGYTADGTRFLLQMRPYGPPWSLDFFFGDLKARTVRRIPCPPDLEQQHLEIRSIPLP